MRGPNYHLSIENGTFQVDDNGTLSKKRLLHRLDLHKGTPPEQIRALMMEKADGIIKMLEDTMGWSTVIKSYDEFEVHVEIRGKQDVDELDIEFIIPVDDYNDDPSTFYT